MHVTPARGGAVEQREELEAVAGRGLRGDYRFEAVEPVAPKRQSTLIEVETIEALERDHNIRIDPKETRRNILTKGVPLNHLVGEEFRVGEARLRGIRLCDPCDVIETLTVKGMRAALENRGGLRAEILSSGKILPGDPVTPLEPAGPETPAEPV